MLNGLTTLALVSFNISNSTFTIQHLLSAVNHDPTDEADEADTAETIRLPIESELDLHAFRPEEVRDVTREYLLEARRLGFREVRLIHGRGRGVQRASVQSLLASLDFVEGFHDDAHLGATVVILSGNETTT